MSTHARRSLALLFFVFTVATAKGYNREVCYKKVRSFLENNTLTLNDTIFSLKDDGTPRSTIEHPVVTLTGCYEMCGTGFGWYKDIGPRLSTWLIPVFLLLSNMEVSPLDKRRYLMILHLLGDPIDSLWSLLTKMEAWSRCYHLALKRSGPTDKTKVRNVATVLGGLEDLVGFHDNPARVFDRILSRTRKTEDEIDHLISRTALQLADGRTDERLRTIFATVLYGYQLVSAFITTLGGGNTSPPGGRIGITMYMTWIVPSILLSNAIGGFTSRRTCYGVLETFIRDTTDQRNAWAALQQAAPGLKYYATVHEYVDSLAWSGAIYSYRPSKALTFRSGRRDINEWILLLLATAPIVISSAVASVILWNTPPIGINCRNILIFVMTALVLLSAYFTRISAFFFQGSRHWHIMVAKDTLLAIPSVVLIFLACAGRFNSCWCWSGVFSLGSTARIPLNAADDFIRYNGTTYPILVSVCLSLQVFAFFAMMWVGWRGWNVLRWSEEERKAEWKATRDWSNNSSDCIANLARSGITTSTDEHPLLPLSNNGYVNTS
jgi:hypothetical protein